MGKGKDIDYYAVGKRIRELRVPTGVSQVDFAKMAGITSVHLSNVECGHCKPSLPVLLSIANVLGCGLDNLLWDNYSSYSNVYIKEFASLVSDCNAYELKLLSGAISGLKEQIRVAEAHRIQMIEKLQEPVKREGKRKSGANTK